MRLHDYLHRVGIDGPLAANAETLRRLHVAHREAFLFENISIQAGGSIDVSVNAVERKFLDDGGGGYCFEHNTLFAAALRELGFVPVTLLGRVRRGPPERWARTHMVLRVPIGGEDWLADVGFGGLGLLEPIPLRGGAAVDQGGLIYRLRRERGLWILAIDGASEARADHGDEASRTDLYEFSEDPQTAGDVDVANHFTATHPDSMFRRTLTIQSASRHLRLILRGDTLTRYCDGRSTDEHIEPARLREVVRELFGVDLPEGPFVSDGVARA